MYAPESDEKRVSKSEFELRDTCSKCAVSATLATDNGRATTVPRCGGPSFLSKLFRCLHTRGDDSAAVFCLAARVTSSPVLRSNVFSIELISRLHMLRATKTSTRR